MSLLEEPLMHLAIVAQTSFTVSTSHQIVTKCLDQYLANTYTVSTMMGNTKEHQRFRAFFNISVNSVVVLRADQSLINYLYQRQLH